ncbi:GntR family transcriptional regulator [Pandoraea pnomenusa]|uniref:GntR family transcriptional regulator n=1 Tax=Pandoraea TaxID=93217 RepID=UPI000422A850|nr:MULTISPECIES: GntR family transcriptional regulator [Pandoraea]AHB77054.2 GntR family transcriptional regulator [Pandoraea pnomenusa]AHN74580.2 GntR family transcriptional regulator [Pandoraea pnomenusa]MBN9092251.1 GntR family transcriptional regulator [Pandoraea pnomenusa]QDH59002.1 GntR family transcriptional regulator [Pandoraea pnomenusa]
MTLLNTPETVTLPLQKSHKLRTLGMAAEITARLRMMIEEGELPPGERIDEKALCELFDVSKTPLREALKTLVSEGLVLHRQYIGYRVAPLDLEELRATFETLHGLEHMAGELAARRLTDKALAAIEKQHGQMLDAYGKGLRTEYFRTNQAIHQMIVDGAGNPVLASIYASLMSKVHRARGAANADMSRWQASHEEHDEIIAALREPGRPRLAEVLRAHSENTAREVLSVVAEAIRHGAQRNAEKAG